MQQADISSRIQAEKIAFLGLRQQGMQAEHAKLGSEAELIELQLNTIKGQVVFGEDELNRIQGKIADERKRLIETLGTGASSQTPGKLSNAWIVELLDAEEQFWNTRFRIYSGISLSERKLALDAFKSLRETTGEWGQIAKTLAIGIGFGAQTLLKNFISGIILSLERPFRVGDLIEVDGITGRIQKIGLRASVIEHFDGIETLVPNSSLVFSLLYWVDVSKTARERLASDLRFMIEKALADAGIAIPFPQRDVHFNHEHPLRVELSRPASQQE